MWTSVTQECITAPAMKPVLIQKGLTDVTVGLGENGTQTQSTVKVNRN